MFDRQRNLRPAIGVGRFILTRREQERGLTVAVRDVAEDGRGPGDLDAVILAASVHMLHHEAEMARFVLAHREALESVPAAFLSVSMAAAAAENAAAPAERRAQATEQARQNRVRFLDEMAWHPEHALSVAGALVYTRYNPLLRLVMRAISGHEGAPTDTTRDYEFTDWAALDRFADRFAAEIAPRPRGALWQ